MLMEGFGGAPAVKRDRVSSAIYQKSLISFQEPFGTNKTRGAIEHRKTKCACSFRATNLLRPRNRND